MEASLLADDDTPTAGDTALITSTRQGDLAAVVTLCQQDIDVNKGNQDNYTALHIASHFGLIEIVNCLLTVKHIQLEVKSVQKGRFALYSAARNGHLNVVEVLLSAGANTSAADKDGYTPIHISAFFGNAKDRKSVV